MFSEKFFCIDAHTCGNPVRLVVEGAPSLTGNTMMERRLHFMREYDWMRTGLMFEPRGHDMMSGSMLYPAADSRNDIGVLFIETSGCLPMCGHGAIGTVTIVVEEGLVVPKIPGLIRLEVPAGVVVAEYKMSGKKVSSVKIINVASYLAARDLQVQCPELGKVIFDVAYGGNFYAIVEPQPSFSGMQHYSADQLIAWGRMLRQLINDKYSFAHPENTNIQGCSHVMWTGDTMTKTATARNAVFYGDKAIDRSPCGTGTSARMAQWHARGLLKVGEPFIHESIIGSQFVGRIEREVTINGQPAIIPSIEGWAKITGYNTIIIDDDDPYARGFQVI